MIYLLKILLRTKCEFCSNKLLRLLQNIIILCKLFTFANKQKAIDFKLLKMHTTSLVADKLSVVTEFCHTGMYGFILKLSNLANK